MTMASSQFSDNSSVQWESLKWNICFVELLTPNFVPILGVNTDGGISVNIVVCYSNYLCCTTMTEHPAREKSNIKIIMSESCKNEVLVCLHV